VQSIGRWPHDDVQQTDFTMVDALEESGIEVN